MPSPDDAPGGHRPLRPGSLHLVPIGKVDTAYGVAGWIKVQPFGDLQDTLLTRIKAWHLARLGQAAVRIVVERARVHGANVVAKLAGCDDRDAALAWRGAEVLVERECFPATAEDEYYWIDLVGCRVEDAEARPLGDVVEVVDHGAHPLLRLAGTDGREHLIPFVAAHIGEVDVVGRRIVADWSLEY